MPDLCDACGRNPLFCLCPQPPAVSLATLHQTLEPRIVGQTVPAARQLLLDACCSLVVAFHQAPPGGTMAHVVVGPDGRIVSVIGWS